LPAFAPDEEISVLAAFAAVPALAFAQHWRQTPEAGLKPETVKVGRRESAEGSAEQLLRLLWARVSEALQEAVNMKDRAKITSTQNLFDRDPRGRTRLFDAAEQGLLQEVETMIFSLTGTGFYPQRLSFLEIHDNEGLTAADVAEQSGHKEIAELLRHERRRMEYFE
jgi:hypothetical protein